MIDPSTFSPHMDQNEICPFNCSGVVRESKVLKSFAYATMSLLLLGTLSKRYEKLRIGSTMLSSKYERL